MSRVKSVTANGLSCKFGGARAKTAVLVRGDVTGVGATQPPSRGSSPLQRDPIGYWTDISVAWRSAFVFVVFGCAGEPPDESPHVWWRGTGRLTRPIPDCRLA